MNTIPALYRATLDSDPVRCEVIGMQDGQYVLREVGKLWPGVWLAGWWCVAPVVEAA